MNTYSQTSNVITLKFYALTPAKQIALLVSSVWEAANKFYFNFIPLVTDAVRSLCVSRCVRRTVTIQFAARECDPAAAFSRLYQLQGSCYIVSTPCSTLSLEVQRFTRTFNWEKCFSLRSICKSNKSLCGMEIGGQVIGIIIHYKVRL